MIIVTGGLGYIGSNIIKGLNDIGYKDIIICDWIKNSVKRNIDKCKYSKIIKPDYLFNFLNNNKSKIDYFHVCNFMQNK